MENVSEIPVWSVEFITETLVLPMLACVMRRTYKNVYVDLSRLMILLQKENTVSSLTKSEISTF